ncbi:MAG: hypothetical protein GQ474_05980 [Sulfurimonas sp.]|nr:hypothetical protein [Sulfurimonas sp.]
MYACKECPFIKRANSSWKGYLSEYKDGMELHNLAQSDVDFRCHVEDNANVCRGYALYMRGIFKRSRHQHIADMQDLTELADGEESLASLDGSKIREWHNVTNKEVERWRVNMQEREIALFCNMVALYDQVGEVKVWETEKIEVIETLSNNAEWTAINALFSTDDEHDNAEGMFCEHFGLSLEKLNELADEFGYQRMGK